MEWGGGSPALRLAAALHASHGPAQSPLLSPAVLHAAPLLPPALRHAARPSRALLHAAQSAAASAPPRCCGAIRSRGGGVPGPPRAWPPPRAPPLGPPRAPPCRLPHAPPTAEAGEGRAHSACSPAHGARPSGAGCGVVRRRGMQGCGRRGMLGRRRAGGGEPGEGGGAPAEGSHGRGARATSVLARRRQARPRARRRPAHAKPGGGGARPRGSRPPAGGRSSLGRGVRAEGSRPPPAAGEG